MFALDFWVDDVLPAFQQRCLQTFA